MAIIRGPWGNTGDLGWLPPDGDGLLAQDLPWISYLDGDTAFTYRGEDAETWADDGGESGDQEAWVTAEAQSQPVIPQADQLQYFGEDAELATQDNASDVADTDAWTTVEDQSSSAIASFFPPAQYYGEDAELLDQDDDDQVILPNDPTDGIAAYYGEDAELEDLDQDDDSWIVETGSSPVIPSLATYYGEDAELLDQDDDDQVLPDLDYQGIGDSVPLYSGDQAELLDQDDDDQVIVDEYQSAVVLAPTLQYFSEDAELLDQEDDDQPVLESTPVSFPDALAFDDPWDHFPTEDDDQVLSDDFSNDVGVVLEDAWDHFTTDDDEQIWTDDYAQAVAALVSFTVEDGWDHFAQDEDEYQLEDYQIINAAIPVAMYGLGLSVCITWAIGISFQASYLVADDPRYFNGSNAWLGFRSASGGGIW